MQEKKITVIMRIDRISPGAVRYAEICVSTGQPYKAPNDPGCQLGTVYIRKSAISAAGFKELPQLCPCSQPQLRSYSGPRHRILHLLLLRLRLQTEVGRRELGTCYARGA